VNALRLAALAVLVTLAEGCISGRRLDATTGPRALVRVAEGRPDAMVDLADDAAAAQVQARWRVAEGAYVDVPGVELGADGRPEPSREHRALALTPRPRDPSWEAAAWTPLAPHDLPVRRGHGHLAMGWFRVELVLPAAIEGVPIEGATIVLEATVDDYAEVWVDGRLRPVLGERGGPVVAGWNAPNRVVLTRDARPGMRFDVAILAINGPLSRSPENFYFVRDALLEVHAPDPDDGPPAQTLALEGAALAALFPEPPRAERLVADLGDVSSLLWAADEGALWIADAEADVVRRFTAALDALSLVRTHAGFSGGEASPPRPGIGGMARDAEGRLVWSERGRRRVVRTERTLATTVLADRGALAGAVPGALVLGPDGATWTLVEREGERHLVRIAPGGEVARIEAAPTDGCALTLTGGTVLVTRASTSEVIALPPDGPTSVLATAAACGGLAVDTAGRLLVPTPGGLAVHAPDGARLGVLRTEASVRALAWGEPGTLYLVVADELLRLAWPGGADRETGSPP
jgi:gluconolactonase